MGKLFTRAKAALTALLLMVATIAGAVSQVRAAEPLAPKVAVHVSENTPPTLSRSEWSYGAIRRVLEESLRSDGTPFVNVSDADIANGGLQRGDSGPKYPIVISLAAEQSPDSAINKLRDYVKSGGLLLAGSSSFTAAPAGATLRSEMGIQNDGGWFLNKTFTAADHRVTRGLPKAPLDWRLPLGADSLALPVNPNEPSGTLLPPPDNYHWRVKATEAQVLASGTDNVPVLTTRAAGSGQYVYHAALQPMLGHGGFSVGHFAYLLYRNTIEWAFERANTPMVKLSPWRYAHDAAFVIRHDLENYTYSGGEVHKIKDSACYEKSKGVKGDYVFSTGALQYLDPDGEGGYAPISAAERDQTIQKLREAVSECGATIGSHNGGKAFPDTQNVRYRTYHWGPDEAASQADGKESVRISFADHIEKWLSGITSHGRQGCVVGSQTNPCPRMWASPNFNATQERSLQSLSDLGVIAAGEQIIGPFPHFSLSPRSGARYNTVTLPVSPGYVGKPQLAHDYIGIYFHGGTQDPEMVKSVLDFYYNLGGLVNIFNHLLSTQGFTYIDHALTKPNLWKTNAVEVADWWQQRSKTQVDSSILSDGAVQAKISGATDPGTAIELVLPQFDQVGETPEVKLNGTAVSPGDTTWRKTRSGVKVKVGTDVSTVEVRRSGSTATPQTGTDSQTPTAPASEGAPGELRVTGVTAAGSSPGSVGLEWKPVSGATDYKVYASTTSGSGYFAYTSTGGTATKATAYGLSANTWYFVVRAVTASGESANSNEVCASTVTGTTCSSSTTTTSPPPASPPPPPPPPPSEPAPSASGTPTNLTVLKVTPPGNGSGSRVDLNWTGVSGATAYRFYVSTTAGSGYFLYSEVPGSPASLYSLSSGKWYIVVRAVTASGESANSNEVLATIP